jgi:ATP synthase protein I
LLGYVADKWLGTDPWLVVVGILLGSYSGFLNIWRYLKRLEGA